MVSGVDLNLALNHPFSFVNVCFGFFQSCIFLVKKGDNKYNTIGGEIAGGATEVEVTFHAQAGLRVFDAATLEIIIQKSVSEYKLVRQENHNVLNWYEMYRYSLLKSY